MPDEMTLQSVPGFDTFLEHEKKTLWVFSHIGIIPKIDLVYSVKLNKNAWSYLL